MQILWILGKKPAHGYMLMKKLSELKRTKITQGTLYPTMQRLQELGLVEAAEESRKRVYSLTAKGKRVMKSSCGDFCATFQGIFHDFVCHTCGATAGRK
jgi:DNA-binding PadR family transcriptional regulator